jgi:Ca2+-transporting ATPase
MLKLVRRAGCEYQHFRQQFLPKDMLRFPFDSARKRMSTVLEFDPEHDDQEKFEHGYAKRIHTKGASEIILQTCTHYLD